jgi:hypothetical protein
MEEAQTNERRTERSAHAIYGLIIVTAALVADREFAEDAWTSLVVVWGAGVVLLLAHLYAAIVAEAGTRGRLSSHAERHLLIADNLPLLSSVLLPTVLLTLSGLGLLELRSAIDLSIAAAIVALFAVGAYQGRASGSSVAVWVAVGMLGAAMGAAIILLEVMLAH